MGLRDARRGQSIQIGFIILFGALVILFSLYQAYAVPQQNAEVESNHQQTITQEMHDLRNAIVSVPATRSDQSVTLTLGTTYPSRLIAMNPPPPSGVIRTAGTDATSVNLTLANAVATNAEVSDYWNGTNRSFNTGNVVYTPNYHEYDDAGTILYESTTLYRSFDSGNLSVTGQRLVDGKRLTLVTLNGSTNRGSSTSESLTVEAVSASETSVGLTNETGDNVTIRVASQRPASEWEDLLRDDEQFTDQGGHVLQDGVTETQIPGSPFDVINIELEGDVTYSLTMAKAGIGTSVTDETATYLADVQGEGASIEENSTKNLVVQVRDSYNNPVTDVQVNASVESGGNTGSISPQQETTGVDGEATFEYEAGNVNGQSSKTVAVNFSTIVDPGASFDRQTPENVTMNVSVQNTGGQGVGGGSGGGGGGGGGGATLGNNEVAFADADGDETYDSDETAYKSNKLKDFDKDVDLVISKDISENKIGIQAETIKITSGNTVESSNDNKNIKMTATSGAIDANNATIKANGGKVELIAGESSGTGDIDLRNTRIQAGSDRKTTPNSGTLRVNSNGGNEADGGTYIVDTEDEAAELTYHAGQTNGESPEKGELEDET
jgi:hypothetical protein